MQGLNGPSPLGYRVAADEGVDFELSDRSEVKSKVPYQIEEDR